MIRALYRKARKVLHIERDDSILRGILDGSRAFTGPDIVQFDITNRCNNNCLCCWSNSPLLGKPSDEVEKWKRQEIPFDMVAGTIRELKRMGTSMLFFAGGGEPFMHPRILDILTCAKKCGMRIFINTNFTRIDEEMAREIAALKVDLIHVSLHAGNAQTYARVHPNKNKETFYRIQEVLEYLMRERKLRGQESPTPFPHVDLYYVIFNENYRDIRDMVDFAAEIRANSLEFMPVDVIPGKTDSLLLTDAQRKEVIEEVKAQKLRLDEFNKREGGIVTFIEQYDSFISRMSAESAVRGGYEAHTVTAQPCYAGWAFARILANGNVNPCLKAHRISVGNIYEQPFGKIWNGAEQREFRRKSFALDGKDDYFRLIGNDEQSRFGCLNSCDNIQINVDMHGKFSRELRRRGRIP
ncbi:MAG: radical SAM protein [Candidatus Omnitrophota bacterium]|jgi:MoaA/NifB/PqqE/SkfB family radical SAM enzyme